MLLRLLKLTQTSLSVIAFSVMASKSGLYRGEWQAMLCFKLETVALLDVNLQLKQFSSLGRFSPLTDLDKSDKGKSWQSVF